MRLGRRFVDLPQRDVDPAGAVGLAARALVKVHDGQQQPAFYVTDVGQFPGQDVGRQLAYAVPAAGHGGGALGNGVTCHGGQDGRAELGQHGRPFGGVQHVVAVEVRRDLREHHDRPVNRAARAAQDHLGPRHVESFISRQNPSILSVFQQVCHFLRGQDAPVADHGAEVGETTFSMAALQDDVLELQRASSRDSGSFLLRQGLSGASVGGSIMRPLSILPYVAGPRHGGGALGDGRPRHYGRNVSIRLQVVDARPRRRYRGLGRLRARQGAQAAFLRR